MIAALGTAARSGGGSIADLGLIQVSARAFRRIVGVILVVLDLLLVFACLATAKATAEERAEETHLGKVL